MCIQLLPNQIAKLRNYEAPKLLHLVQLTRFFVFGVFTAVTAIFSEFKFLRCIDFIPFCHVVLTFAHGADESEKWSLIFFSHMI